MKNRIGTYSILLVTIIILGTGAYFISKDNESYLNKDIGSGSNTLPTSTLSPESASQPDISIIASNLRIPWQIAEVPDGRIFFTERIGTVRVIEENILREEAIIDLQNLVSRQGEGGLLGIAADPDFQTNKFLYILYTTRDNNQYQNNLTRYKETEKNMFIQDKIVLSNIPGGVNHNGGVLKFGPDGKLYIGMGEHYEPDSAQNLNTLSGKILRMNADGTIPTDNPFENSYVWSYGHRNPQGLTWDTNNTMYATEHGPSGGQGCCQDEINKIEKGKNYGWPLIRGTQSKDEFIGPLWISGASKTWAPGNITYIRKGPWTGSIIFTGLRGQALYKITIDQSTGAISSIDEMFANQYGRLREVIQLENGDILISTSHTDGRGTPDSTDDKILRIRFNDLRSS